MLYTESDIRNVVADPFKIGYGFFVLTMID